MSTPPFAKIVLVLGAGGNVGSSVAKLFSVQGYKVALAARRLPDAVNEDGHLQIKADFSDAQTVTAAFDKTAAQFGSAPNVVIYNACGHHRSPAEDPLDVSFEDFHNDLIINTGGAFVAAKRAVQSFRKLPSSIPKAFFYTGNILNVTVMPAIFSMGVGKTATANLIATSAKVYPKEGVNFYYVDERTEKGGPVYNDISGPAHAKHFLELAEAKEQRPWLQTFVDGEGYKDFSGKAPVL